jgi:Cof subfamily protein (haloacid dehalogenase superfamily)
MSVTQPQYYNLLACDLDGTLMGHDISIPLRVRHALSAVQAKGIYVTIATGRGFLETLPFARLLAIGVPIICHQGSVIKHPKTGELFYRASLKRALALQMIELARLRNWHMVLYVEDKAFVQEFRHPRSFYDTLLGSNIEHVKDLARLINSDGLDPTKCLVVAQEGESDRIQAEMDSRFDQQMNIVRSHNLFVEGTPLGVDKGTALQQLADLLSVPQVQVMAIGDQDNDAPMLTWAGLGVAMGNGSEAAIASADWIAPPQSAHGAAVAVERFLLTKDGKLTP